MAHTHKCGQMQKLKRGLWSPDEDERLLACIMQYGPGSWSSVPSIAGIKRCGKSCRLRWINYLRPDLKHGSFSALEEKRIIELHAIFGNKWSKIASHLPGRTDNEIKNLWNSSLRKRRDKKTAQNSTDNAHKAANLKEAESVIRPCKTTAAIPPCMPSWRPIFPFSRTTVTQECEERVLLATRNVDVKPPIRFDSNPNEISVNEDLILSGHASLQETLLGPNLMNQDELLGSDCMPMQELVTLAQSPGNSRLQIQKPAEQMVMNTSTCNTHITDWQHTMDDIEESKDCRVVRCFQLQPAAGNRQAPCAPDSFHSSTACTSTQTQYASRETFSLIDYGACEAYPYGVNHHSYLLYLTADQCNSIDGGVYSLKHHQQQRPTAAANHGMPFTIHQLESASRTPSSTCSHELGPTGQSPSTSFSEVSSGNINLFFDYDDADFWLQEGCIKAT